MFVNRMINRFKNKALQVIGASVAEIRIASFKNDNYLDLMQDSPKHRLPDYLLHGSTKGVIKNSAFLSGHMFYLRATDSSIDFTVTYKTRRVLSNMSPLATSGIDIYKIENNIFYWIGCFGSNDENSMFYSFSITDVKKGDLLSVLLPGYASISHLFVSKSSVKVDDYRDYKGEITLYGSSVTQGCASTRPGLCYANLMMFEYHYKVHNFGFSESAKGEDAIIDYISSLHSTAFILEYDHNATVEELKATHERVYRQIRLDNPEAAIIMISRISGGQSITMEEEEARSQIIQNTYLQAINAGDKRISYIRGRDLVGDNPSLYLKDDRHPNDDGMKLIADAVYSEMCKLGVK